MSFVALKINEVVGSTVSTDVEYVELVGPAGLSLDGYSLIVVESDAGASNGTIDSRFDFTAADVIGDNGFFLIGNASVLGTYGVAPDFTIPNNSIENSSYTVALVETASLLATTVAGSETVVDALGISDGGAGDSFFFGAPVVGPDGSFLPAGARRLVDGVDTDTAADWGFADFNNDPAINTPTAAADVPQATVINEVLGSTTGTDVEYIELFGEAGASLDGLSLIVVESDDQASNGTIDFRFDFAASTTLGDNGYFLLGTDSVLTTYGVSPNVTFATNAIENSSYTLALVETASITGSAVTGAETVLDAVGVTDGESAEFFAFDAPVVGPDGSFLPAGVGRTTPGFDTDTAADWDLLDFFLGDDPNSPTAGTFTSQPLVINEVLGSTTGIDVEYIELVGDPGASLAGLSLIVVESDDQASNGSIDKRFDFSATDAIGDNGFFLLGNASVIGTYGVTPNILLDDNFIENSSYTLALVETASLSGSSVSGGETVLDAVGVTDGEGPGSFFFDAPVIGPDGSFLPAGVGRLVDGVDTDTAADWKILDFNNDPSVNTPTAGTGDVGGPVATERTIMEIQGSGISTAFEGELVETTGVVTAVVRNSSGAITGAYIQDANGDGDDSTSDAIFVNGVGVSGFAVGDAVTVIGTVNEFEAPGSDPFDVDLDITGLTIASVVEQISSQDLPDAVVLDTSALAAPGATLADARDFFEAYEGMLVTAPDLLAVSATNRFGEIFAVSDQGANASGLSSRGTLNLSVTDYNPEKIQVEGLNFGTPLIDTGALLGDVTGVLSYEFGNYEILATEEFTSQITRSTLTQETSALASSSIEMTVASYNVLNLDINDNDGDADVANGRFEALAQQIVANLNGPDVIGLQEVQDNSGSVNDGTVSASATLQALVDAIAAAGGPQYAFIDNTFITDNQSGGQPGGNIRTAFLYNADRVSLVDGSVQTIGTQSVPGESFAGARLPLVADFEFNGETVTVVNNHFSSKGGSAPIVSELDDFETRQDDPAVNGSVDERLRQAEEVKAFVEARLAADGNANLMVLGDFNEFEFNTPVELLEGAGLTNLTNQLPEDERYTFNFQGNSQALDHILVSASLVGDAQFDVVHTNSEFAATDSRASDHDPLVASLRIVETETVSVELFDRFGLGSKAIITDADGETDREILRPITLRGFEFEDIGLTVTADHGRLSAINGGFGVASFLQERPRDWDEINDDETVVLTLDDRLGAEAVLRFDVASGAVDISAFRDGAEIDLGADVFQIVDNAVSLDSPELFDEIVIGNAGADLALTAIEIDRVVQPEAPAGVGQGLAWSAPSHTDSFDFV